MCRWLKEVFGADSKKAARTCNRITDMVYSHEETFTQKSCSFYDPEVKNGGPNPDPAASGKRRNKEGDWVPRRTRRQAAVPGESLSNAKHVLTHYKSTKLTSRMRTRTRRPSMIAMALKRHHISRSGARQIKKQIVESVLA